MPRRASRRSSSRRSPTLYRRRSPSRYRRASLPRNYASAPLLRTRSPSLQAAVKDIIRAQSVARALSLQPSPATPAASRGASVPMLQSAVKQVISAQKTVSAFNQATNLGDGPAVSAAIVEVTKPILINLVSGAEQQQLAAALQTLENHFKQQAQATAIEIAKSLLIKTIESVGMTLLYILSVAVILFMTVSQCSQFRVAGCITGLTLSYSLYQKVIYTIYMQFMNLGPFVANTLAKGTMFAIKLPYYTLSYGIMPIFNWVLGYLRSRGVHT